MAVQVLAFAVVAVEHMGGIEGEDFGDFHRRLADACLNFFRQAFFNVRMVELNRQITLETDLGGLAVRIAFQADVKAADFV